MFCPECGKECGEEDRFCKHCGAPLKEIPEQTVLDDLIREYQREVAKNPNNADVHYNLGMAYYEKGHYGKAVGEWEKVLEIDPTFDPAKEKILEAKSRLESSP